MSLASGRQLTAKAVIYCTSRSIAVQLQWWQAVSGDRTQHRSEALQERSDCPAPQSLPGQAQHASEPQQNCEVASQPQHASEVDIRTVRVEGATVAIVGSGMTAAQLAIQAVARGAAQVLLISRHSLIEQPFSCEVPPPVSCLP